jgi:hypothetical protein
MGRDLAWKILTVASAALGAVGIVALTKSARAGTGRIALIGDSYAVGLGPELQKMLGDRFQYEGHVGISTASWAAENEQCSQSRGPYMDHGQGCGGWLREFGPDLVLVSLGVNDGGSPNPATYQAILRSLQDLGARVVWIEPPAGVSTPNVRSVISVLGVPTVAATSSPLGEDGLHPRSYAGWAQEVAQAIV